jgi:HEAT repeat protein
MEHPVTFAKEFAELVRHVEERVDISAQKAALRRCLVVLKSGPASLSAAGDVLFAGRSIVPSDADATALALKISSQSVGAIAFEAGAAPSDVIATARWLVAPAESTPLIAGMKTVRVDPVGETGMPPVTPTGSPAVEPPEPEPPTRRKSGVMKLVESLPGVRRKSTAIDRVTTPTAPRRKSGVVPTIDGPTPGRRSGSYPKTGGPMPRRKSGISGTFPVFGPGGRGSGAASALQEPLPRTRATELLDILDRAGGSPEVTRTIDELVITAEQAAREDDLDVLAEAMVGLFTRQSDPRGGQLITQCAAALARLINPTSLRLLVQAAARTGARTEGIQAVLTHARDAGAAALIAQVTLARTLADRRRFFEMLLKLPAAAAVLTRMLASPHWHVARNAADLLGQLHATEAESALAGALQHQDERVRRAAAHALARLGTSPAIDSLHSALGDASPLVRVQAASGLAGRKGTKVATTLTRALDVESDTEAQLAMIAALGKLATPDAVNRLIAAAEPDGRLFKKKPVSFRVAAVHALGEVRTTAARTVLQTLATDKEREVREAVMRVVMQSPRGEALDQA